MYELFIFTILGPAVDPIYREWKSEWEVMLENFEERCDNCLYTMRNMESEEVRQDRWFDPSEAENKKREMLAAVLGLDYFTYETEVNLRDCNHCILYLFLR